MKVIKPPESRIWKEEHGWDRVDVFLGGSIEMGKAEQWQDKLIAELQKKDRRGVIYNPRRDDWDSTWAQTVGNAKFKEQVDWELSAIQWSDVLAFYFDPKTMSPITLFELGLAAGRNIPTIVYCPEGYWRKGNVDIYCARFGLERVTTFDEFVYEINKKLDEAEAKLDLAGQDHIS